MSVGMCKCKWARVYENVQECVSVSVCLYKCGCMSAGGRECV